jgi:phosphoserine phosphatase
LFDIAASFIPRVTFDQLLAQTGITAQEVGSSGNPDQDLATLRQAAARLEGVPLALVERIHEAIRPTPGTTELIQTLKTMGYRIALASTGFDFFTHHLQEKLAINHAFGVGLEVNDDAMILSGDMDGESLPLLARDKLLDWLCEREGVSRKKISLIRDADAPGDATPGIRLTFDMKRILELHNQRVLSREAFLGLLAGLGLPRPTIQGAGTP